VNAILNTLNSILHILMTLKKVKKKALEDILNKKYKNKLFLPFLCLNYILGKPSKETTVAA